ncbi:hypothetical protein [Neobacillus sp. CF12]|uniref:hypothetical protein n=1 Tax=Neobacillus sp. CF12 TaxID=3055864 RepID=UPI0025A08DFF|nr:hypothetical protein [Neobacillus sp. CF12]MDM5329857.1 hypothetical protein [Neobacillus sp. CF12]
MRKRTGGIAMLAAAVKYCTFPYCYYGTNEDVVDGSLVIFLNSRTGGTYTSATIDLNQ